MDEIRNILIQVLGAVIFVMAVTLLLFYVKEYEITYDTLMDKIIKDTVIIRME